MAAFDADGDGDLDLYFVQGRGPDELWMGSGDGRFERGTRLPENPAYGMGVAVGDFDGDGDPDLVRTGFGAATLLRNDGDLVLHPAEGLPETPGWSASATTCDYDGDGRLDLFVTRYMDYDPGFTCHAATGAEDYCNPTEIPGSRIGSTGTSGADASRTAAGSRGSPRSPPADSGSSATTSPGMADPTSTSRTTPRRTICG